MNPTTNPALSAATQPPRNGSAKTAAQSFIAEAQGYQIAVVNRLEALVTAPDGTTHIFSASLEVVTPEVAKAYLAKMRPNRHIADARVAMWGREMEARRWRPTNQGIGFDADGYLIVGQHRLSAVVASGQPAIFLVVRGLPTETQNVVDSGRPRRAGDQFNITFGSSDGKQRVAAARIIHLLRSGWMNPTEALTTEENFRLVRDCAREIEWAMQAFPYRRRVGPAPVAAAWAYAYAADPSVGAWAEAYMDGAGLGKTDPLLMLREYVLAAGALGSSGSRMETALKTLRALWAKRNGEPLRRLYASADGLLGFAKLRGDDIASAWDWYRSR